MILLHSQIKTACGNSSVVEHDLAKVGVASSNLVSRSILISLFLFSILHSSDNFVIKDSYCVDGLKKVTSSLITKQKTKDFFILKLPANRAKYTVSSLKILSKFKENDINITDLSGGVVVFKNCKIPINIVKIKSQLAYKFKKKFPTLKIKTIYITSPSSLSPTLSFYHIDRIKISNRAFNHAKGSFSLFLRRGKKRKQIYLKYEIDATIVVLKANYNLRNGKILQNNDYVKTRIRFNNLPIKALGKNLKNDYIVKGYIRKGSILSMNNFKVKKAILKGEYIKAILKDGNLILEIDAHLLSDADIGDTVQLRTVAGRVYRAKIVSMKTALIQE